MKIKFTKIWLKAELLDRFEFFMKNKLKLTAKKWDNHSFHLLIIFETKILIKFYLVFCSGFFITQKKFLFRKDWLLKFE